MEWRERAWKFDAFEEGRGVVYSRFFYSWHGID
jgi:hypothetical protein